jgi:uncharacterized protein (TIGR02300 family)
LRGDADLLLTSIRDRLMERRSFDRRGIHVAKADLGIKRTCPNCGAKYYDLNRNPIICPRCGTYFEASSRRPAVAAPIDDEELEVEAAEGTPEFVPLETADEEASGGSDEEDIEIEADDEADAFLEEEEEDGDDVTGIIGEVDDEDEEP